MTETLAPSREPSLWLDSPASVPRPVAHDAGRLRPPRQRPVVVDALAAAAGIGLGVTIGLAVTAESAGSLSAPGGVPIALGRLSGLLAAYAMVVVVLLVARVPPLEARSARTVSSRGTASSAPGPSTCCWRTPCSSRSATRARRATVYCTSSGSCC